MGETVMQYEKYYLILFNSRNYAISMESLLKKKNLDIELFQAPEKLANSCTLAIKFQEEILESVMTQARLKRDWVFRIYIIIKQNGREMIQVVPHK